MHSLKLNSILLSMIVLGMSADAVWSARPAPPSDVQAKDAPGDVGTRVVIFWKLSPDDTDDPKTRSVISYDILRKVGEDEAFEKIEETTYGDNKFVDENCEPGQRYYYQVVSIGTGGTKSAPVETTVAAIPDMEYFNTEQAWFGIILVIVCGSVTYFIEVARTGRDLKIRKIAGLEAVEEAVGRATEMGRSCIFVPGILDVNDIQTIAGITILARVSRLAAEYDARIEVPTTRALVMTTCRETVESAYLAAGRPDAYREDDVYYLTDEQFGYVAGVTGTMVREKPAACFYMGAFFAESLLLAETGNSIGAIQVAGTAMPSQLPFFVAACDYTLIGEEFFAASAYLSGEAHQLGSLKGQDVGKVIGSSLLVLACGVATLASITMLVGFDDAGTSLNGFVAFIQQHILGAEGFLP